MSDKGQALVEFALLLPIMLLFLALVVDAGTWNYQRAQLQTAASASAQAGAAMLPDTAAAEERALQIAEANGIDPADVTVNAEAGQVEVVIRKEGSVFFSQLFIKAPEITGRAVYAK